MLYNVCCYFFRYWYQNGVLRPDLVTVFIAIDPCVRANGCLQVRVRRNIHDIITVMMTSSNWNTFRATGHLCGEFAGYRWIPRTKASDAELWFFLICAWINGWVNIGGTGDLKRHRANYDVTVMWCERHGVSSHRQLDCLFNSLFELTPKNMSKVQ